MGGMVIQFLSVIIACLNFHLLKRITCPIVIQVNQGF